MPAPSSQLEGSDRITKIDPGLAARVTSYLEERLVGGRGGWDLNGVELLLELWTVVVYVCHRDHDAGRRRQRRPPVVSDCHLKQKIMKF